MEASYPVDRDTAIKSSKRWLSFQTQNNKKVIIVQSNQMVNCQEQRRRMRATLAGKYVHIRRMERDHKNEEPRPPCLQNRFFLQTTLSIVHQIHNDLYDLSDFAADHPGGQSWIEMTRGQVNNSQQSYFWLAHLDEAGQNICKIFSSSFSIRQNIALGYLKIMTQNYFMSIVAIRTSRRL